MQCHYTQTKHSKAFLRGPLAAGTAQNVGRRCRGRALSLALASLRTGGGNCNQLCSRNLSRGLGWGFGSCGFSSRLGFCPCRPCACCCTVLCRQRQQQLAQSFVAQQPSLSWAKSIRAHMYADTGRDTAARQWHVPASSGTTCYRMLLLGLGQCTFDFTQASKEPEECHCLCYVCLAGIACVTCIHRPSPPTV